MRLFMGVLRLSARDIGEINLPGVHRRWTLKGQ
jgi:hypothetical protein